MWEAIAIVVAVFVAAALTSSTTRRAHLRERRIDATTELVASFIDAARTGTDLLQVHTNTGYPHELSRNQWNDEQIKQMTIAHTAAWEAAWKARDRFELATFQTVLVATDSSTTTSTTLRDYLDGAIYSGTPWGWVKNYPTLGLNPSEIVPEARNVAEPLVAQMARSLWGGSVPIPNGERGWWRRHVGWAFRPVDWARRRFF